MPSKRGRVIQPAADQLHHFAGEEQSQAIAILATGGCPEFEKGFHLIDVRSLGFP